MISHKNILELEKRRQIYNIILEYPGLHLRELSRKVNISFGGLRHHLNYLKKQDYVVTKSDQRYTRYYAFKKVSKKDKELFNILRQKIPRKIVILLINAGPAELFVESSEEEKRDPSLRIESYSKNELMNATDQWKKPYDSLFHLNKKRMTIDFHLKKLIDAGIVEKIHVGRETRYKIVDKHGILLFLAEHRKTLSDDLINFKLTWQNKFVEKRIDDVINIMYEILPHPYHV